MLMCALSEPICTRKMRSSVEVLPRTHGPLARAGAGLALHTSRHAWTFIQKRVLETFEEHLREELRTLDVIIDVP